MRRAIAGVWAYLAIAVQGAAIVTISALTLSYLQTLSAAGLFAIAGVVVISVSVVALAVAAMRSDSPQATGAHELASACASAQDAVSVSTSESDRDHAMVVVNSSAVAAPRIPVLPIRNTANPTSMSTDAAFEAVREIQQRANSARRLGA